MGAWLGVVCACEPAPTGDAGADDSAVEPGPVGTYAPFEAKTWAFSGGGPSVGVALVDSAVLSTCSLVLYPDDWPGVATRMILVYATTSPYANGTCKEGLYPLNDCEEIDYDRTTRDCPRYYEWDDDGALVANVAASGGALRVTDRGDRCSFELEAHFAGHPTVSEEFVIPYDDLALSYCLQ